MAEPCRSSRVSWDVGLGRDGAARVRYSVGGRLFDFLPAGADLLLWHRARGRGASRRTMKRGQGGPRRPPRWGFRGWTAAPGPPPCGSRAHGGGWPGCQSPWRAAELASRSDGAVRVLGGLTRSSYVLERTIAAGVRRFHGAVTVEPQRRLEYRAREWSASASSSTPAGRSGARSTPSPTGPPREGSRSCRCGPRAGPRGRAGGRRRTATSSSPSAATGRRSPRCASPRPPPGRCSASPAAAWARSRPRRGGAARGAGPHPCRRLAARRLPRWSVHARAEHRAINDLVNVRDGAGQVTV